MKKKINFKKFIGKKFLIISLILFVSIVPVIATTISEKGSRGLEQLYFEDGILRIQFRDKAATSNIVFKTIGWTIHKDEATNFDAFYTQKGQPMIDSDLQEVQKEILPDGSVVTDFEIDSEAIEKAFSRSEDLLNTKEGGIIYLDSIFEVRNRATDKRISGPHYSYKEIVNAAGWGQKTKEDLKSYYNIPIEYRGDKFPLTLEMRVNGKTHSVDILGEGKAGDMKTIQLPSTITLPDGTEAKLDKSWIEPELRKGMKEDIIQH